ncbi:MAG: hypothetical protein HND55_08840 [Pseudomonadota bacterium]|nr:MAG: hypothetical protein HND55_08840 [Pseudomonadota bacterium]
MTHDSAPKAPSKPNFGAGMTPGRLPGVDGRTWAARRYREIVEHISADTGGDMPTAKAAIVCRAAALATWCEQAEAEFVRTGELDTATFTTATNTLRRLLLDIGLERVARDVTPTLAEYIEAAK